VNNYAVYIQHGYTVRCIAACMIMLSMIMMYVYAGQTYQTVTSIMSISAGQRLVITDSEFFGDYRISTGPSPCLGF